MWEKTTLDEDELDEERERDRGEGSAFDVEWSLLYDSQSSSSDVPLSGAKAQPSTGFAPHAVETSRPSRSVRTVEARRWEGRAEMLKCNSGKMCGECNVKNLTSG